VDSLIVYHQSDIATWAGRKQLLTKLRNERFDLFIELSNIIAPFRQVMQSLVLARWAGCRYAVGFRVGLNRWFPRTQALHIPFEQEAGRLWKTLNRLLDLGPNESGKLPVSEAERAFVRKRLKDAGLSNGARMAVMHVGGKRPANRWFEDRYAAVADWIQTQNGIRVVLTGVDSERERIDQVRSHMRSEPIVVCGELNLLQTAALLEQACLYVGNDTGPMHIAAAMGTRAVAIFSARDFPRQWYPYGDGHIVLRRDVPCSPCFKDVCDRGLLCLDLIQIDDVRQSVQLQLSRDKSASSKACGESKI
jgi:ADP-heptose:LPS heptosyltransferase